MKFRNLNKSNTTNKMKDYIKSTLMTLFILAALYGIFGGSRLESEKAQTLAQMTFQNRADIEGLLKAMKGQGELDAAQTLASKEIVSAMKRMEARILKIERRFVPPAGLLYTLGTITTNDLLLHTNRWSELRGALTVPDFRR